MEKDNNIETVQPGRKRLLKKLRLKNLVINLFFFSVVGAGLIWTCGHFWKYLKYDITNDAFIDQYVSPVNIRVSGYIKEVRFREHQFVRKGDTLLILDDSEYRIRVKEAEAALLDAQGTSDVLSAGIITSRNNIDMQDANIKEARARLWQYEQDLKRYERLLSEESVARHQYEQVKADHDAAQARYEALLKQKTALESQYDEAEKRQTGAQANIMRREADLDLAELNLSYTVLLAPYDGYFRYR